MNTQAMITHNGKHGHPKPDQTAQFGFWVYLMTDCVLFATLFAAYAVLSNATAGGPGGADIFSLSSVLVETFILLTSSFTCGLAMLAAHRGNRVQVASWLAATFFLGASFLALELGEFHHLIAEGNGFQASAFLSSYFTLVGAHGLHIAVGLLWTFFLIFNVLRKGLSAASLTRLSLFSLFWHFLDVIWIFIFTLVYLMGAR